MRLPHLDRKDVERLYSGDVMSVHTDELNSLRASFALQAERLNSFSTHINYAL